MATLPIPKVTQLAYVSSKKNSFSVCNGYESQNGTKTFTHSVFAYKGNGEYSSVWLKFQAK